MAREVFVQHKAEIAFNAEGKISRQVLNNLKEEVDSATILALSDLFVQLAPADVSLTETTTVKRVRHELV